MSAGPTLPSTQKESQCRIRKLSNTNTIHKPRDEEGSIAVLEDNIYLFLDCRENGPELFVKP